MEVFTNPTLVACLFGAAAFGWGVGRALGAVVDSYFALSVRWIHGKVWDFKNPADAKLREEYEEWQRNEGRKRARDQIDGTAPAAPSHAAGEFQPGGYH